MQQSIVASHDRIMIVNSDKAYIGSLKPSAKERKVSKKLQETTTRVFNFNTVFSSASQIQYKIIYFSHPGISHPVPH